MGRDFSNRAWMPFLGFALWGLAWAAAAIASVHLRVAYEAQMLIWPSSGIAVTCLLLTPRAKWHFAIFSLWLANLFTGLVVGYPATTLLVFQVANLAEPLVIVSIVRLVVPEDSQRTIRLVDLVVLFFAALAGGVVSGIIAHPVRPTQSLLDFAWWSLAVSLGVLSLMPLIILLRSWLTANWGRRGPNGMRREQAIGAVLSFFTLLVIAQLALNISQPPLMWLAVVAMVFLVVRYGQIAAPAGVLAIAVVAAEVSMGGHSPAPFMDVSPARAAFVLQVFMLILLATALPLGASLIARDRMQALLERRNEKMRENLTLLNMAEHLAKVGRWRYEPKTGKQDWSPEMFRMNGMDPNQHSDPGDVRDLLPDGGEKLFGTLKDHEQTRTPYSFDYEVRWRNGETRILRMHSSNEFDENGELKAMFGVVLDVTDHHRQQQAVERERRRAMLLAAEAQVLANTDPLTKLANRRRTIGQLDLCIEQCRKSRGKKLALITFDIDHFKHINDAHGHQAGDEVLIRIADIAREQARAEDVLGRTGGEEFVWLLPGANLEIAARASERLRKAIQSGSGVGGRPTVTVSIGYAEWREGDDAQSLLSRADAALYEAKNCGRNRVREAA